MNEQINTYKFSNGLTLYRHYDSSSADSMDYQCGSILTYKSYMNQLGTDSYEYYNQADGTNKFTLCVNLHVYSLVLPFPNIDRAEALTYSRGFHGDLPAFHSDIYIRYFDPSQGQYRFPAALSHEMGHAYHNWAGFYGNDGAYCEEVVRMWQKQINSAHTPMTDPKAFPWSGDPDYEQWANTYRVLFGTYIDPGHTRGSSPDYSPNYTLDACKQGFENPAHHPEWKKMIQFIPELCAMLKAYGGAVQDTLSWNTNCFEFKLKNGTWIYQGQPNAWYYWNGSSWVQFNPVYNRV